MELLPQAADDLVALDPIVARRTGRKLQWLGVNFGEVRPEPLTGDLKGLFKLRVGSYRAIYSIDQDGREMNLGLPNAEQAYVEQAKITEYLLSPASPSGKARFFRGFGFRLESWRTLQQALLRHGRENRNVRAVEMAFGVHYIVEGPLETPDGRAPLLRTVWSVESGSTAPRLVTAYPLRRQDAERT